MDTVSSSRATPYDHNGSYSAQEKLKAAILELGSLCQGHSHARGRRPGEGLPSRAASQASVADALLPEAGHCTMRAMWRLGLALDVLRQAYGRMGAIAWLVAVSAGVVLIICIAIWAKTAPAP